jgi:ankyrin repeat protein
MRCGDGKTPLHYAASVDIARLLLARGADIDALDVDHESTPAQYLVSERPDVARFLITRGCRTDILLAAALGATELVRRILDENPDSARTRVSAEFFPMRDPRAGGSIYIWTLGGGKSAFIIAREKHHDEVANLLAERATPVQLLADLCLLGDADGVHALRTRHPEVSTQLGPAESGLLSNAVFDTNVDAVRLMLESGWPVGAPNAEGVTALHGAAWHGHANLVRALLDAGAEVNPLEKRYGGTPLDWARHGAEHSWRRDRGDYPSVLAQLQRAGGTQSA